MAESFEIQIFQSVPRHKSFNFSFYQPYLNATMNLLELSSLVHDKNLVIIFLQAHGILNEQRHCSNGHMVI